MSPSLWKAVTCTLPCEALATRCSERHALLPRRRLGRPIAAHSRTSHHHCSAARNRSALPVMLQPETHEKQLQNFMSRIGGTSRGLKVCRPGLKQMSGLVCSKDFGPRIRHEMTDDGTTSRFSESLRQLRSSRGMAISLRSSRRAAAMGMAIRAPMIPRSAPPMRVARTVTTAGISTARPMILGTRK